MRSKIKVIIAGAILITNTAQGQDYTNLKFSSPLKYNPALTGLQNDTEINLRFTHLNSYFSQNSYNSLYGDFSQYSKKLHGGVGFYLNTGNRNNYNFTEGRLSYAFQNKINDKWNYSIGSSLEFSAGVYKYGEQLESYVDTDLSVGGIVYSNRFFTSINADNLLSKDQSFSVGVGREFNFNTNFSMTPSFDLISNYGSLGFKTNVAMRYKKFNFGLGYNNGRLNANVGYDFKKLRVNYSIGNIGNGFEKYNLHEVSLKFRLNNGSTTRTKFNFNLF